MQDLTEIAKAFADTSRVRIIACLRGGELCVCQIVELLGLAGSTVSQHLEVLRQAQLVDSRKVGRWMYYRRANSRAPRSVRLAMQWVENVLADDEQIRKDNRRLKSILKIDPEDLCIRQRDASERDGRQGERISRCVLPTGGVGKSEKKTISGRIRRSGLRASKAT